MNQNEKVQLLNDRTDWTTARPQKLPRPTYWPFFFAMGLALLGWGLLAGWIISVAGLLIMAYTLAGWITELRYESGEDKD